MNAIISKSEWNGKVVPMAKYLINYNKDSSNKFGLCFQTVNDKLWASFATGHIVFRQRIFTEYLESSIGFLGTSDLKICEKSKDGPVRIYENDGNWLNLNDGNHCLESSLDKDVNIMLGGNAFWKKGGCVIATYNSIESFNKQMEETKTCHIGLNLSELSDIRGLIPCKDLYIHFKTYKASSMYHFEGKIIPRKECDNTEANFFTGSVRSLEK